MTVYKDIPGFEGRYQAGDDGTIYSMLTDKILKQSTHKNTKYKLVNLTITSKRQKVYYVHRLVAASFLGVPPKGIEVNHKNGIKGDNRLSNLEYMTHRQNQRHSWDALNRKPSINRGEASGNAKLNNAKVKEMRHLYATGDYTYTELGKMYGIGGGHASKVVQGKAWSHI